MRRLFSKKTFRRSRSISLGGYNHAIDPDVYANRPTKPVWTKEKEKPLREQKIELVVTEPVNTGTPLLAIVNVIFLAWNLQTQEEKSEMRPLQPVALPNLAKELRYQRNLFPVLGSRDAVAPNDLLPENTTLGAKENTKKTRLEHEAEREAIQRSQSLDHGRVLTVDDASRDSMIRLPRQRFASDSIRPSQHLRAYMESGAHAVRNGAERRVIYQQSNAAASQHAHIHGGSHYLARAVAQPIALDTRVVADAKHFMHPTRPTLP
ncbi:hypothetical protein BJ912DRAFT_1039670 [Pholiota molesta]|nr:hypothetical protein BJ912DRAFT_1039670 [Pholiota molesta]